MVAVASMVPVSLATVRALSVYLDPSVSESVALRALWVLAACLTAVVAVGAPVSFRNVVSAARQLVPFGKK